MTDCRCRCHLGGAFVSCDTGPEVPGGRSCTWLHGSNESADEQVVEAEPLATRADHWAAVDRLVNPTRRRLTRDNGASEHVTIPSLFDQLVEAIETGGESSQTHGVPASKPPMDTAALSLLLEIAELVRDGCRQRGIQRTFDTPKDLRALTSAINTEGDPDRIDGCARLVKSWCSRITATISNDPDRSWRMHGAACRVCRSTTVPTYADDGTEARQPALIVHSEDGRIQTIECAFCGSVLTGPDMTAIVLDARRKIDREKAS